MKARPEQKSKRQNLLRWEENRLRRVDSIPFERRTAIQRARRHDLANSIMVLRAKELL